MEDILKEINFEKFDNSQNTKMKQKINKILQRKLKMDKLVKENSGYFFDEESNNILIENLDSCIKDHTTIFKKLENDIEDNFIYVNKMKEISKLFDNLKEPFNFSKMSNYNF